MSTDEHAGTPVPAPVPVEADSTDVRPSADAFTGAVEASVDDVPTEVVRVQRWFDVAPSAEVTKRKRVVVDADGLSVLVLAHEGGFYAFDNICIHRDRELVKGVILNGKLVCPGHQWAFALDSGWEAVKEQCQPVHEVRVEGDLVQVLA